MQAHEQVHAFIESKPLHPDARRLQELLDALKNESEFLLSSLYSMDLAQFDLALELLQEWRLARYHEGPGVAFTAVSTAGPRGRH